MNSLGAFDLTALPVPYDDGSFMSAEVGRIAELIQEYDHTLEVRWIPKNRRSADEPAFAIVCKPLGAPEYVVMYVASEDEFDQRILQRLFQADAAKQGNVLSKVDAANAANRAVQAKRHAEERAEAADLAASILRSNKHVYRHNGVKYE